MNKNQKLITEKSIMYKFISLGCSVYVDDWDNFIVNILICKDCKTLWNNSRTECFYCGTENFHVYTCTECGKRYSITNASQKCSTPGCNGILVKRCLNNECPSNSISKLQVFLDSKGGVFEKKKSGSCYNEMRCKSCGNNTSIYVSKRVVIVDEITSDLNDNEIIYIKKNSISDFDVVIDCKKLHFSKIEEIIEKAFNINLFN